MFDIGFVELLLVAIVGLIVLGPERLPTAIRTLALYFGRLKRAYRGVKADIEREIGADEIRRQLHNEEVMQSLKTTKDELDAFARDAKPQAMADELHSIAMPAAEDESKPVNPPSSSNKANS